MGVGLLVGGAFLFVVANDAFTEISLEIDEKKVTEKLIKGDSKASSKVAIITIDGMIVSDADGFIARQIRAVIADKRVRAVVLRVDSPGGTMSGSDYYHHLLKKMKSERSIPVVVSMGSVAASGGYYVSVIGDEIYAEPSTITGSIGVVASLFNASELLEKIGVESTPVVSGDYKTMGSFMKPMSEEERALFQRLIDDNFDRFKTIIREGRSEFANNPAKLDKLATGEIFTADDALKNEMIDKIGFLDDAVERAISLARLTKQECKVIRYTPKLAFVDMLMESRAPGTLLSGETLSKATTPKIYLICPRVVPVE